MSGTIVKIKIHETNIPPKETSTALYCFFKTRKGIIVPMCKMAGPIKMAPKAGKVDFSNISSGKIPVHLQTKKPTIAVRSIGTLALETMESHSPNAIKAKITTVAISGWLSNLIPPFIE